MAKKSGAAALQENPSATSSDKDRQHQERERMIREAAYYRFVRRGYMHGYDLDDWITAEAELLAGNIGQTGIAAAETADLDIQQRSIHSPREDEALKRVIRKHPQRDIPQIEGIEPQDAPLKE